MKNAFIYFVIGLSALSFCSTAFTEDAPQTLEQDSEHENAISNQEPENNQAVEEKLPEDTIKHTPKKKKKTKKARKEKQKTDKKKAPKKNKKTKKNKAKQKKKTPAITEEEIKTKDLSSSQDEEAKLPSETRLNSTEDSE